MANFLVQSGKRSAAAEPISPTTRSSMSTGPGCPGQIATRTPHSHPPPASSTWRRQTGSSAALPLSVPGPWPNAKTDAGYAWLPVIGSSNPVRGDRARPPPQTQKGPLMRAFRVDVHVYGVWLRGQDLNLRPSVMSLTSYGLLHPALSEFCRQQISLFRPSFAQ